MDESFTWRKGMTPASFRDLLVDLAVAALDLAGVPNDAGTPRANTVLHDLCMAPPRAVVQRAVAERRFRDRVAALSQELAG